LKQKSFKATINDLIKQKDKIESAIEQMSMGKIIAQREAYPGVTMKILDQDKEIKSEFKQGTFFLKEGIIAHDSSLE
jgi:uncharacterized protein (DUF342 family)